MNSSGCVIALCHQGDHGTCSCPEGDNGCSSIQVRSGEQFACNHNTNTSAHTLTHTPFVVNAAMAQCPSGSCCCIDYGSAADKSRSILSPACIQGKTVHELELLGKSLLRNIIKLQESRRVSKLLSHAQFVIHAARAATASLCLSAEMVPGFDSMLGVGRQHGRPEDEDRVAYLREGTC